MLWLGMAVVLLSMLTWLVVQMTVAASDDAVISEAKLDDGALPGPLPPAVAFALYNFVINIAYFGGAIMAGQVAGRNAQQRTQLAGQARRLEEQSALIARRAVIEERLRIARELHDGVAHHIAVIGIQAGASRRVLSKRPEDAAAALESIESSSRQAVQEMRSLLGVLRAGDPSAERPEAEGTGTCRGGWTAASRSESGPERARE